MFQLKEVSFAFDAGEPVLRHLSLTINSGEKVCLMGHNGSGKSTLLKLCAGLLKPTAGELLADGEPIAEAHRAGFIFQNPDDQIVGATVAEDIAFALQNLRVARPEIVKQVERVAEEFSLRDKLDAAPEHLSAGQRQRLALAGVFIADPRVLLIDEPTSYLDDAGRAHLRRIIQNSRMTTIAATQYVEEATDFDRVILLDNGAIVFDGAPRDFVKSGFAPAPLNVREVVQPGGEEVLLEAKELSFAYAIDSPVIRGFSHSFRGGEITAIMGASGSGKTSLALLLAGLIEPDEGEVKRCKNAGVGLLLQFPEHNFFADTVFDEVAFAARNQGSSQSQVAEYVRRALEQVGLDPEQFSQRNPFTLSAGEQRRVAIAAVLVMECSIYIFDEITCGLDWEGRQLVAEMLVKLAVQGKSIIICGHDRALAGAIGARVLKLAAE